MFRVLAYNVNGLRGGTDRVAQVIEACAPDIACLQESPRAWRWRSRCAELARQCGLEVIAGGYPAGLLVLGDRRVRAISTEARWLSLRMRYLQRGLTLAVIDTGDARVTVANIHLDLDLAGRRRHLTEVLARVEETRRASGGLAVVAGDVNEKPTGPVWQALAARFQDGYAVAPSGGRRTFPASRPRRRVDAVFASAGLTVHGCGVPDFPGIASASDHRPVLAELSEAT